MSSRNDTGGNRNYFQPTASTMTASPAQQWTASVSSIDRHYQLVRSSQVRGGGGRGSGSGSGSGRESGSGGGSLVVPEEASSSNISSPHQLFSSSASLSVSSPWQLQQQQQLQQQLQLRPQQCGHTSQYFSSADAESRNSDIDEVKSIQPVLGMTPFIANSPSFSSPTTTTTNTTITSTTAIPAQLSQLSQISQLSQQHNSCTHSQLAVFAQQQRQQSEQHHVLEATEYRRRRGLMGTILLNDTTETTAASATAAGHVQMPIIPVGELANDSNIIDSDDIVMDSDGHDTDIEDNEDNEDNGRRSADYISLAYSAQWAGPSIARMSTVPVDISMDQATMDIDMDNTAHTMAMDNNNDTNNDTNGDAIHSTAPMIGPVASAPLPVNYHGITSDIVQQQQQQHHQQVLNTYSAVQLGSPRSPHVVDNRYTHMKSYVDRSASNSGSDSGAKDRRRSSPFGQLTRFVSQVALIPFKTLRHKLSALGSSNSSSNKNNSSSKNNNNSGNTPVVAASAVTPATVPMNARPGLSFQRKRSNKALIISNPTNFTHIAHIGLDGVVQNDIDPVYQQPDPSETQKGHQAHSRIPSRSNSLIPAAAKSLTLPQSSIAAMAQAAGITPLPVAALPPPPPFLSPSEIPQLPPLPPLTAMSNIGSHFRSVSGTSANFSVSPSSTIRATGSHNKPAGETVRMVSGTNTTLNGKSVPVQYQMSVPQLSVGLLPAPTADYMADPKLDDLTGFDFSYETVFGSTSIKEKLATTTATTNTVNKRMSVMSSLSKRLSGISIF